MSSSKRSSAAELRPAITDDDPVLRAIRRAPVDDGPVPEQELRDMEAARASGQWFDGAAVTAELAARAVRDGVDD
jgi:hypothetical protein